MDNNNTGAPAAPSGNAAPAAPAAPDPAFASAPALAPATPTARAGHGAAGLSPAGASRRRLAGIGASGVLLTLASNGAMATMVCKSPSGAMSGNLVASRAPASFACEGRSPGYWKNHPRAWSGSGVRTSEQFNRLFSCGGRREFESVTCMSILSHKSYDTNNLAMHLMATYLNVASGNISFMSLETVTSMWTECIRTGSYKPSATAKPWNAADIVIYLRSTMS